MTALSRSQKLNAMLTELEDALLYAKNIKKLDTKELKESLGRMKLLVEQGSWTLAERLLSALMDYKKYPWLKEFSSKKEQAKSSNNKGRIRFIRDGLCEKYGHMMVKVRISNLRWYYECRLCGKKGKYATL